MKVKFKKLHHSAMIPSYALPGDAGLDLTAISVEDTYDFCQINFGLAVEIPPGYFGLMVPRSGVTKMDLMMKNSVGIIDSGYRGELVCRFKRVENRLGESKKFYKPGDKAAQLLILPYPTIEPEEVDELSDTVRAANGFGSTNAKN